MDHLAIMKKSWGLTQKILSKEKVIESRWYKNKASPWGKIKIDDIIYFKDSGEAVSIKAEVENVISYENLNPQKILSILNEYGKSDGLDDDKLESFYNIFKDKKYCLLIFLKNPTSITPFNINKKGFGMMSAWLTIDNIEHVKINVLH